MANTRIPSNGSHPMIANLKKEARRKLSKRSEHLVRPHDPHSHLSRKAKKKLSAERHEFVERVYGWLLQDAVSPNPEGADAVPRVMVEVAIDILNRRDSRLGMDLNWWNNYLGDGSKDANDA